MLAASLYFVTLALFGFVVLAAAHMPEGWLVACILQVFLAGTIGVYMSIYSWAAFGAAVTLGSLVLSFVAVRLMRRRVPAATLFIALCSALVVGLVSARVAFWVAGIG
jgi:hypothetical protein